MERHRGEIYGDHMDPHHKFRPFMGGPQSTRPSSVNPIDPYQYRNPNSYSGLDRGDLAFDIPRFHPGPGGPGAGGFLPMGGGENGCGGHNSGHQMPPVSGQKRAHPFSGRGGSPGKQEAK
ncbi:unnamed protein product [Cuscuta campestris]|uniref:Uncharacterized protein n=1 Tax=Cuscuta campestris TaxID=132261 RepID=A0A484KFY5_9ASTE|nr:unnamed protein product [Cuscuta campestris]